MKSLRLIFASVLIGAVRAEDDDTTLLQTITKRGGLCSELSDGRLDYLAGGPYNGQEVGQIACHMVANINEEDGVIIASPSKGTEAIYTYDNGSSLNQNNYYNMWQRDAGLTMRTLVRIGQGAPSVKTQQATYAKMLHRIWGQQDLNDNCAPWGVGPNQCNILGEPKFWVNGSVYNLPWGRNQNDGPAINAMNLLEATKPGILQGDDLENAIDDAKRALAYIGGMSSDSTEDPWEMIYAQLFFVKSITFRAVASGLEDKHTKDESNLPNWIEMLRRMINGFWDPVAGALVASHPRPWYSTVGPKCLASGMPSSGTGEFPPCELDIQTVLGSLYSQPAKDSIIPQPIPPYDSQILATAAYLVDSMGPTYAINKLDDAAGIPGVLIGRYPGDEYSGVLFCGPTSLPEAKQCPQEQLPDPPCTGFNCGNPWFLTTHALAEVCYEAAGAAASGKLIPDRLNSKFILMAARLPKNCSSTTTGFPTTNVELATMLQEAGDAILARAKHHAKEGLHMSEQIYRGNGAYPFFPGESIGARDLTWSYASVLDALASRSEAVKKMSNAKSIKLPHFL